MPKIRFDDVFLAAFWSFPLGKDKLVVVLEEMALERTQLDLKEAFKGNLIPYKSHDV